MVWHNSSSTRSKVPAGYQPVIPSVWLSGFCVEGSLQKIIDKGLLVRWHTLELPAPAIVVCW